MSVDAVLVTNFKLLLKAHRIISEFEKSLILNIDNIGMEIQAPDKIQPI